MAIFDLGTVVAFDRSDTQPLVLAKCSWPETPSESVLAKRVCPWHGGLRQSRSPKSDSIEGADRGSRIRDAYDRGGRSCKLRRARARLHRRAGVDEVGRMAQGDNPSRVVRRE